MKNNSRRADFRLSQIPNEASLKFSIKQENSDKLQSSASTNILNVSADVGKNFKNSILFSPSMSLNRRRRPNLFSPNFK